MLSRYEVLFQPGEQLRRSGSPRQIKEEQLFETPYRHNRQQMSLFDPSALGESGWIKALRLEDYAPRKPCRPQMLQEVLFSYLDTV